MKLTECRPIRADGTVDDRPYLIDARSSREFYGRDFPVSPKDRRVLTSTLMGMMRRCYDKDTPGFHRWGGRGITVGDEWYDKERRRIKVKDFILWAVSHGWKRGLQIDRINNDGNYEPSNCRFVTSYDNNRNRSDNRNITFNGKTMCMRDWADELKIPYYTLNSRINIFKWDIEKALTEPIHPHEVIKSFNGKKQSISAWAREYGIKREVIKDRMLSGWSFKDALTAEKLTCHERLIEYKGERKNIKDWCKHFNLPYRCVLNRMNRGWSIERTFETPVDTRFGAKKYR